MENASKALLMAAGVLIGVLILSLAVFLFVDFGSTSESIYSEIEGAQLTQYNVQYTVFSGRNDITIYEIISVANLANENNNYYKDYTDHVNNYDVQVNLGTINLGGYSMDELQDLIKNYSIVDENGDLKYTFSCTEVLYHNNGRVKKISFKSNI